MRQHDAHSNHGLVARQGPQEGLQLLPVDGARVVPVHLVEADDGRQLLVEDGLDLRVVAAPATVLLVLGLQDCREPLRQRGAHGDLAAHAPRKA